MASETTTPTPSYGIASLSGLAVLVQAIQWLRLRGSFVLRYAHGTNSVDCQRNSERDSNIELERTGRGAIETKAIFFYIPDVLQILQASVQGLVVQITQGQELAGRLAHYRFVGIPNFSFLPGEAMRLTLRLKPRFRRDT